MKFSLLIQVVAPLGTGMILTGFGYYINKDYTIEKSALISIRDSDIVLGSKEFNELSNILNEQKPNKSRVITRWNSNSTLIKFDTFDVTNETDFEIKGVKLSYSGYVWGQAFDFDRYQVIDPRLKEFTFDIGPRQSISIQLANIPDYIFEDGMTYDIGSAYFTVDGKRIAEDTGYVNPYDKESKPNTFAWIVVFILLSSFIYALSRPFISIFSRKHIRFYSLISTNRTVGMNVALFSYLKDENINRFNEIKSISEKAYKEWKPANKHDETQL